MIVSTEIDNFFANVRSWVNDGCSVSVQYVIIRSIRGSMLLGFLRIGVGPMPIEANLNFSVNVQNLIAGQIQLNDQAAESIVELLRNAARGTIEINGEAYSIPLGPQVYSSERPDSTKWDYDLHLRLDGSQYSNSNFDYAAIDQALRVADPPFDGIDDLKSWLGVPAKIQLGCDPVVELRVRPPVDLVFDHTALADDRLSLVLNAHHAVRHDELSVAIRTVPGDGISGRRQIATCIAWEKKDDRLDIGTSSVEVNDADAVLVMISLAGRTIRRHWFIDPVKARNSRAFATRCFDKDLRQLRRSLFETQDSAKFESAMCSLLFMLGLSPAVQLETDAPDIIATTPGGQMILIECTLRTADFASKLGKLVDRRNSMSEQLEKAKHHLKLHAILVCRVPRAQLVIDDEQLSKHRIRLMTVSDIESLLNMVNLSNDPDAFFESFEGDQ